jgi:hypothetical protein
MNTPTPQSSSSAAQPQNNAGIALRAVDARISTSRYKSLLDAEKASNELLYGMQEDNGPRTEYMQRYTKPDGKPTRDEVEAIDTALSKVQLTSFAAQRLFKDGSESTSRASRGRERRIGGKACRVREDLRATEDEACRLRKKKWRPHQGEQRIREDLQ